MSENRKISIGSFNFYIGIAMLFVVLVHTIELFSADSLSFIVRVVFTILSYIGVAGFALISGYKLKLPNDLKKYIIKTCKDYLKLYYVFGIVTVILFGIIHAFCFRYIHGTIKEMFLLAIGFLFAVYPAIPIGDVTIYSCGPLHFIVAFTLAEIIAVIIICVAKKFKGLFIVITMLIGCALINVLPGYPFALSSAMLLTGCIYAGYFLKNRAVFEKGMSLAMSSAIIALSICIYLLKFIPIFEYLEPFITMITGILAGSVLINYCISLSQHKNRFVKTMKEIGRVSFFVLGAHTIEYFAIPWYLVADKMAEISSELGALIIYVIRLIIIFVIVKISMRIYKHMLRRN